MLKCPNYEPITNKALENMRIAPSPENRTRIFHSICIPIRFLLAGIILQFKDNIYLPYILLVISLVTSYRLYNTLYGPWWWKRTYHLVISILLAIVSIAIIFKWTERTEWMAYILYMDVIIGIIQSLGVTRC